MKTIIFTLLFIMIYCLGLAQVKPLDDGNYNIAQQKLKQGEILIAYKNFLIFEYLNYDRISLPINSEAKNKLEALIKKLENHLLQSGDIINFNRGSGWSIGKADSVMKANKKELSDHIINILIN